MKAVEEAWAELLAEAGGIPFQDEEEVNYLLCDLLNVMRVNDARVPEFSAKRFGTVAPDATHCTFDGSSLKKRPDLAFRLASHFDTAQAWFLECKIVDADHRHQYYIRNGVARFVNGEYGWAMTSGFMIAYAGDGYSLSGTLPELAAKPSALSIGAADLHETSHQRSWTYPNSGVSPGDITLVHRWLPGASFARK